MARGGLEIIPVEGLPEIAAGDPLGELISAHAELRDGDIVAVVQKVVSKVEDRSVALNGVKPGPRARALAAELGYDPALVELILSESRRIVRSDRVLIVETLSGLVCANAGIDASNSGPGPSGHVLLLPRDPDASARRLRAELAAASGRRLGVVVTDSFGRPWRVGQSDVAIGCAGLAPLENWRGRSDRDGRELAATEIAIADEVAAAADLGRDKDGGIPAVLVRGLADRITDGDGPGAVALQRAAAEDLFR